MFTYVTQSWWVNSNQTYTGKPEIWFCCSAMTADCKDFPLLLLTGVAAYSCLKVILKGKKAQSRATPGKKKCWIFFPWLLPLTPKGSVCVRHSIFVMYCLLTLLLFSLATPAVTKAGCTGTPLEAQYICIMLIHAQDLASSEQQYRNEIK